MFKLVVPVVRRATAFRNVEFLDAGQRVRQHSSRAREGQVAFVVATAVLNGDDVFGLVGDKRLIALPRAAVLAAGTGALADESTDGDEDHYARDQLRTERALA